MIMLDRVRRRAADFDILHFHIDLLQFPLVHGFRKDAHDPSRPSRPARSEAVLHSLSGRAAGLDLLPPATAHAASRELGRQCLSRPARRISSPIRLVRVAVTWRFSAASRRKSVPDRAIEIAARAGPPLKIAAKIDKVDRTYWTEMVSPMIDANPLVEYIGEIDEPDKARSLGRDGALVPDRLAGAVRAGHDRSDGVRHARYRFSIGSVPR